MTAAAAVAVCDALQKVCELETGIKWVNDVYSKGSMHKLCGILSESSISMETGKPAYAIIGIGLNVNNTSFPPEIKKVATSVFLETNRYYSRSVIAAEILNALERRFDQIDGNKYIEDYRRLSVLIGREVRVSHDGVTYSALVTAIDDDGQLVLESELGHIVTLSSGSVSLL
jgi:BirA family biotin operon repressor/biotin-[acetyl-CoA-carboxylase] ligase